MTCGLLTVRAGVLRLPSHQLLEASVVLPGSSWEPGVPELWERPGREMSASAQGSFPYLAEPVDRGALANTSPRPQGLFAFIFV